MVGGFSFARSKFNRATQARRQVGSLFKPIVYTAAIDRGFTPVSVFIDEPVSYVAGPNQPPYQPLNYDRKFEGPGHAAPRARAVAQHPGGEGDAGASGRGRSSRYAQAVRPRRRLSAVPLAGARRGRSHAARDDERLLGVRQPGRADGAVRRGRSITDREGNVLEENRPEPHEAMRADTAFVMTNLLRGVVAARHRAGRRGARLAARRQDRHDGRVHRRVVRRLRPEHHRRRVGGLRREEAARLRRDRRHGGAADLDGLHAGLHRQARRPHEPARSSRRPATSSS